MFCEQVLQKPTIANFYFCTSQKNSRGWKFWIKTVEEWYYPCSESKGADQLRIYCEADLRLCFRICRLMVFPCGGLIMITTSSSYYVPYHNKHMENVLLDILSTPCPKQTFKVSSDQEWVQTLHRYCLRGENWNIIKTRPCYIQICSRLVKIEKKIS